MKLIAFIIILVSHSLNGEPITSFGESHNEIERNYTNSSSSMQSYCVRENQEYFKSLNVQKENNFEKNKSLVKKDKETIFLYLLCSKAWTKKTKIKIPTFVTNICIIPRMCFHISSSFEVTSGPLYNNQEIIKHEGLKFSDIKDSIAYYFSSKK